MIMNARYVIQILLPVTGNHLRVSTNPFLVVFLFHLNVNIQALFSMQAQVFQIPPSAVFIFVFPVLGIDPVVVISTGIHNMGAWVTGII